MTHQESSAMGPAAATGSSADTTGQDAENAWLRAATSRLVRLTLLDGKTLVGQLLGWDGATLVVQGSGTVPLLIYKHGLAYVAVEEHAANS